MDLTVDALKAIYVALGGNADTVANMTLIPDVLKVIATQAGTIATAATTAELPKVTSSNNGQVLTVDGGKWKAKDLPS